MADQKQSDSTNILTNELLKERAQVYAKQDEQVAVLGVLKKFFCFRLGKEWFLIEMSFVSDIIPSARISCIPKGKDFMLGMMNVRGGIVLIADLARLLHLESNLTQQNAKVVLLKTGENITGFPVDETQETMVLDTGCAQQSIATIQGIEAEFISGLFQREGKHFVWLNIERILLEVEK